MAGFDFGVQTDGSYRSDPSPAVAPPISQIAHFVGQGTNLIRLPVAWQFLQSEINGKLDETNLKTFKKYVDEVTSRGAYAIIDLHAYARYKSQIVGQSTGAPSSALVSVWSLLGDAFKDNPLVMYGISNEPHDLDIAMWADTVQEVVTELRTNKAAKNIILIPGTDYTSMKAFPEWYKVMKDIKNPDGSVKGLLFELHRYLDQDNSGKSTECVASHADEVQTAVDLLKADGRQALLGEVGGGNTASCKQYLPQLAKAVVDAYPYFVGFAMWAAGAFDDKYELVTTVKDASSPTGWRDLGNWMSIQQFIPAKGAHNTATSLKATAAQKPKIKKSACRRRARK